MCVRAVTCESAAFSSPLSSHEPWFVFQLKAVLRYLNALDCHGWSCPCYSQLGANGIGIDRQTARKSESMFIRESTRVSARSRQWPLTFASAFPCLPASALCSPSSSSLPPYIRVLSVVWLLPKVERILPWYSDIEDLNLEWNEFIKKVL